MADDWSRRIPRLGAVARFFNSPDHGWEVFYSVDFDSDGMNPVELESTFLWFVASAMPKTMPVRSPDMWSWSRARAANRLIRRLDSLVSVCRLGEA